MIKNIQNQASLVAHWSRICLQVQELQVGSLLREDPTCRAATKPVCHNYQPSVLEPVYTSPRTLEPLSHSPWACALGPRNCSYWAHLPRPWAHLLQHWSSCTLEPLLHKRSHNNEKPARCTQGFSTTREKPVQQPAAQHSLKYIN